MTIEEKINEHNSKYRVQLTKQMVRYVKRTHGKKNFNQMRSYLGLSILAFRRLACIAEIDNKSRNEMYRRIVEEYAPYMTFKEMSEKFGNHKSLWAYLASKYGVTKSKEKIERIAEKRRQVLNNTKNKDGYWDKIRNTMLRNWRMEYFRVSSGMPQKTNLILRQVSKSAYTRIYAYVVKRGYIQDEDDFKTLYYDDNTKRSKSERIVCEKYKIKILPISEKR